MKFSSKWKFGQEHFSFFLSIKIFHFDFANNFQKKRNNTSSFNWIFYCNKIEPVDFSRSDANKTSMVPGNGKCVSVDESERAFSLYSSMGVKSLKAQSSIHMLRSISSDDLMMKSSDEDSEEESDVDIVGESKGYIS